MIRAPFIVSQVFALLWQVFALLCQMSALLVGLSTTAGAEPVKTQFYESYKVNKDVRLTVLPLRPIPTQRGSVQLKRNTEITLLAADANEKYGDVIRVGIDSDGVNIPSDFWTRANDLLNAGLEQSEISFDHVDPVLGERDLEAAPFNAANFMASRTTSSAKTRSLYTFRYIKQFLLKSNSVSSYLPGASVFDAARVLSGAGFDHSNREPQNAELNDICVYRGAQSGDGHIEIKLKEGWWYGYGSRQPAGARGLQLDGCFTKPPEKLSTAASGRRKP